MVVLDYEFVFYPRERSSSLLGNRFLVREEPSGHEIRLVSSVDDRSADVVHNHATITGIADESKTGIEGIFIEAKTDKQRRTNHGSRRFLTVAHRDTPFSTAFHIFFSTLSLTYGDV